MVDFSLESDDSVTPVYTWMRSAQRVEELRRNNEYKRCLVLRAALRTYRAFLRREAETSGETPDHHVFIETIDEQLAAVSGRLHNIFAIQRLVTADDIGKQAVIYETHITPVDMEAMT